MIETPIKASVSGTKGRRRPNLLRYDRTNNPRVEPLASPTCEGQTLGTCGSTDESRFERLCSTAGKFEVTRTQPCSIPSVSVQAVLVLVRSQRERAPWFALVLGATLFRRFWRMLAGICLGGPLRPLGARPTDEITMTVPAAMQATIDRLMIRERTVGSGVAGRGQGPGACLHACAGAGSRKKPARTTADRLARTGGTRCDCRPWRSRPGHCLRRSRCCTSSTACSGLRRASGSRSAGAWRRGILSLSGQPSPAKERVSAFGNGCWPRARASGERSTGRVFPDFHRVQTQA